MRTLHDDPEMFAEAAASGLAGQNEFTALYLTIFLLIVLLLWLRRCFFVSEEDYGRLGMGHALPVKNLRARWHTVAFDGLLALMCGIPGFGFLALGILFFKYSVRPLHLIVDGGKEDPAENAENVDRGREDPAENRSKHLWILQLLFESLLWANLFMRCCRDVKVYQQHLEDIVLAVAARKQTAARNQVTEAGFYSAIDQKWKDISFDLFGSTCFVTSTLLWRVLLINSIQIKAHVRYHRRIAFNAMTQRGRDIWDHFHHCELAGFGTDGGKEDTLQEERLLVRTDDWNWGWHHVLLVSMSSLVMCGGMVGLHLERIEHNWFALLQKSTLWLIIVSTYQATFFWIKITWGVLRVTSQFRDHSNRLLVLSAISTPFLRHNWSEANLDALDSMLIEANRKKQIEEQLGIQIVMGKEEQELEKVRYVDFDKKSRPKLELDLTKHMNDWWKFRRFLQTDCLDEAAGVEFCSVVVVFLLCNYAAVGLTTWFAHHQVRTVGFLMILLLSAVLIGLMFTILQTCVVTNNLLDMDAELLRAASHQVLKPKDQKDGTSPKPAEFHNDMAISNHALLLHSMERDASAASDKQQLFGIPVTANLRNGWILSLLLTFATSAWKVLDKFANRTDVLDVLTEKAKEMHLA